MSLRRRGLAACATAAVAVTVAAPAFAQGQPAIDPATGALPTVVELFNTSPIINGIIVGLSVISLMLFLFFMLTINARAMVPSDLVDEVNKLVERGKYEAAADLCRAHRRTFVGSILQRAVENAGKGHATVLEVIDSEGRRRADIVWNRISYLSDIANIAPMLGLLGTVLGMITAFLVAEGAELQLRGSGGLATAIGQAMSTTLFGLIVAIGTLVFHTIVKSRVTRVLADAEQAVHAVADRLRAEPQQYGEPRVTLPPPREERAAAATVIGTRSEYRRREEDRP